MIELINIEKCFNTRRILDGINLKLTSDRIVVCGSIGAGKTTLLRLIAGFILPTRGNILLNGNVISSPQFAEHPSKRGIAMVFQNPTLWPHMTVRKNIEFVLLTHKMRKKERIVKIEEIIDLFGLNSIRNSYPDNLSGGEKKKVSLAVAIAAEPKILLLDEPFENIDTELQNELIEMLLRIHQTGIFEGMLCVTHDSDVAEKLGERIFNLRDGKLDEMNKENKGCKMYDG